MPTVTLSSPLRALAVASVLSLAAGCSTPAARQAAPVETAPLVDDFPRSRVVARDFVDAMVQLPELRPARTTLYTGRPDSRFGEILVASLQHAGYDLRLGAAGDTETLGYEVAAEGAGDAVGADRYTFLVTAGPVRLKRTYDADRSGIRPATAMRVHGADATALARVSVSSGPAPAPRRVVATPVPRAPALVAVPAAGVATASPRASGAATDADASDIVLVKTDADPGDRAVTRTAAGGEASAAPVRRAATDVPRKRNLYETRRSNYADLLATYETLRREIMVFPNDSLHMGRDNKRIARTMAAAFDPARDVISVIGCSHGRTALANGNETLANGRAYRVKEALMLAGVAPDLVLEEGCWAGQHFEMMPARGVVVTHKRRAAG